MSSRGLVVIVIDNLAAIGGALLSPGRGDFGQECVQSKRRTSLFFSGNDDVHGGLV
jgi:hypothetical protein